MPINPGALSVVTGQYSGECTTQNDLIANSATYPQIREIVEYVQRRQLMTLLVSGALQPYGLDASKATKIPNVDTKGKSMGVGSDAYQFRVMGDIERNSVILAQQGSSGADGSFTLKHLDNNITKGSVVTFYGGRKIAYAISQPIPSAGGYLVNYMTPSGQVFDYSTWVATQPGTKTCAQTWTSFGEKSLRGYGYDKYPDMFIVHMTTQRASKSFTGDTMAQVLWVNYTNETGKTGKAWMFESMAQLRTKFTIQDERQKWFGASTMKNADGTLRSIPNFNDPETGLGWIAGDGLEEQIAGGNVSYGSGIIGQPTADDYVDMMTTLQKKGNLVDGYNWVMVTGTDGYSNFQKESVNFAGSQNIQFMDVVSGPDGKPGGPLKNVGYKFASINFGGNELTCIKHPMFDNLKIYGETLSDGSSVLGSTCFIFPVANDNQEPVMEILHKELNGINRNFVEAKLNGLTGAPEMTLTQEDAMTYACLKQDLLAVYNPMVFGVIYPST